MNRTINLDGHKVGFGEKPFIVAEMSCNHMGDFERAKDIIKAAKEAGADAVKIQTYEANTITMDAPQEHFQINHPLWNNISLHDLYAKAQTPFDWVQPLFDYGDALGIMVFSAPFDLTAVDHLERCNNPIYKIASFEAVHIPLIEKVAATEKPLIISTGMADREEIARALTAAKTAGVKDIILLHCISSYPTPFNQANLNTIPLLGKEFGCLVGLSDHTKSPTVAELAVGLGACLIEKHMMLHKDDESFDAAFSLTPDEFAVLVETCKHQTKENFLIQKNDPEVQEILGKGSFERKPGEKDSVIFRPSILAAHDIKVGEKLTEENMIIRRPSCGLAPHHWNDVLGKTVTRDLKRGDGLSLDIIQMKDINAA